MVLTKVLLIKHPVKKRNEKRPFGILLMLLAGYQTARVWPVVKDTSHITCCFHFRPSKKLVCASVLVFSLPALAAGCMSAYKGNVAISCVIYEETYLNRWKLVSEKFKFVSASKIQNSLSPCSVSFTHIVAVLFQLNIKSGI